MDYEQLYYELLQKIEKSSENINKNLNRLAEQNNDEQYVYKTSDKTDYLYALHGVDFLLILWGLDQWLRNQVKYNPDYSSDTKDGFVLAREQIYDLMQEKNLSLDMLQ